MVFKYRKWKLVGVVSAVCIAVAIFLSIAARPFFSEGPAPYANHSSLWLVKVERKNPLYLFGTMHAGPARMEDDVQAVVELLKEIEVVFMEADGDTLEDMRRASLQASEFAKLPLAERQRLASARGVMVLPNNRTLKDVLPRRTLEQLVTRVDAAGIPAEHVEQSNDAIWRWSMGLFVESKERYIQMDLAIQHATRSQQKRMHGLDDIDTFVNVWGPVNETQQIALLHDSFDRSAAQTLILYEQGMFDELEDAAVARKGNHKDWREDLAERLIDKRNRKWFETIESSVKGRSALVVVGASHLGGEQGLISLYRNAGYTISRKRLGD